MNTFNKVEILLLNYPIIIKISRMDVKQDGCPIFHETKTIRDILPSDLNEVDIRLDV